MSVKVQDEANGAGQGGAGRGGTGGHGDRMDIKSPTRRLILKPQ